MGIESALCKIRRDFDKEGHLLNRAKQALTVEAAKTVHKAAEAVVAIAVEAYLRSQVIFCGGYNSAHDRSDNAGCCPSGQSGFNAEKTAECGERRHD